MSPMGLHPDVEAALWRAFRHERGGRFRLCRRELAALEG